MKVQPNPCTLGVCRNVVNMDADGNRWIECRVCGRQISSADYTNLRMETPDAKQIRNAAPDDGRSRTRSEVREEGWRAKERGPRVQSGGQRARRKIARAQRLKETEKK